MAHKSYKYYFKSGVSFLKEHPQLWFTAFVGLAILGAFIFTAYRFATIALDAQEELVNVRVGSILDTFVLFAPDVLENRDVLRERLNSIQKQNPTIDQFSIVASHGTDSWRIYTTLSGDREGTVYEDRSPLYKLALSNPQHAYTSSLTKDGERHFITIRAIERPPGTVVALAVTSQGLSEADKNISDNLMESMLILTVVMVLIMALFIRHARIVDFATLYRKQLEVDEMKDSFISMASHELKSPLTVIRGYIEFLKDGVHEEEKRQEYLHRIDLSANELRQLVDDILDVSRIEMGRLRFSPDYVKSMDVLNEVHEMFTGSAESKNLNLKTQADDDVKNAVVRVDRGRLKQVMINLVSNALKYTLAGDITIGQKRVADKIEISVHDTGVGMTSDEQAKLFGKFYRIESSETKGVSGTGLGLWITKYIVEHMGGRISVESIKGEGSRFVVSFSEWLEKGGENAK